MFGLAYFRMWWHVGKLVKDVYEFVFSSKFPQVYWKCSVFHFLGGGGSGCMRILGLFHWIVSFPGNFCCLIYILQPNRFSCLLSAFDICSFSIALSSSFESKATLMDLSRFTVVTTGLIKTLSEPLSNLIIFFVSSNCFIFSSTLSVRWRGLYSLCVEMVEPPVL